MSQNVTEEKEMRKITINEAAQMMQCSSQQVRMMIQLDKIPGATCYGPKHRRTYYVTDVMIQKFMEGGPK